MLDHSSVVVSTEGKEKRKEKKEKKKEKEERKKRSSEALQLDCVVAEGQPRTGRGRDCLLRSIAAFLDSNGFFKTLSVLQSEAQLEVGCWKSSVANLDDLFGKFLDSSGNSIAVSILDNLNNALPGDHPVLLFAANSDLQTNMEEKALAKSLTILVLYHQYPYMHIYCCAEVGDSLLQDQDDKLLNHPSVKADAKKRKRTSHVDGTEIEIDKTLNNGEKLVIDGVQGKHMEEKAEVSKLDGLSADNSKLSANQLADSQKKVKKKKNKIIPEIHDEVVDSGKDEEMVKAVEELVTSKDKSNITQKSEKKKDKKLKQVEQEASGNASCKKSKDTEFVDSEGNTAFESQVLDGNVAQHKVKKKKQKLNQASEEKPSDQVKQCEIKQDVGAYDWGHQGISVSQDTKSAKKTSKKRKALDSGENVDNENTSKKSEAKSEGAQNNVEIVNLVKSDKYTMDSDNLVITKKRKVEESKGTTKNAVEQLELTTNSRVNGSTSNTKNVAGNQLENASIGKKQKHTEEPKSVNPFQRVKVDHVKFADDRLKDNSYWAKDGADIGYGAKAQEVLGQVRGRDFRHEKTKKKRGSYRGGEIDLQSHSIKFTYSDEE